MELSCARVTERNNLRRLHLTLAALINNDTVTFGGISGIRKYMMDTLDWLDQKALM